MCFADNLDLVAHKYNFNSVVLTAYARIWPTITKAIIMHILCSQNS